MIAWSGKTLGIKALNGWLLQPRGVDTIVWEEESFDGLIARIFRTPLQTSLRRSLQNGLQHLKAEAERRTSGGDEATFQHLDPDDQGVKP